MTESPSEAGKRAASRPSSPSCSSHSMDMQQEAGDCHSDPRLSFRIACGGELLMDFDDPSRIHAAEVIVWLPLGHAPRAGGWHGHQSALADPAGCGALGEERRACTNSLGHGPQ
jgi:hypothetical protein